MASPPIDGVGVDLLREILLRLPGMALLVNAALACNRWRRTASDPVILQRFLPLRRPPLVVFILTDCGDMPPPIAAPTSTSSAPTPVSPILHRPQPTATSSSMTSLISIRTRTTTTVAITTTTSGASAAATAAASSSPAATTCSTSPSTIPSRRLPTSSARPKPSAGCSALVRYAIIVDDADASFRVISMYDHISAAVFSFRTRKWTLFDFDAGADRCYRLTDSDGMPTDRFVYWRSNAKNHKNVERILLLDMGTMEWTVTVASFRVGDSYCVADMAEHGGLCLVSSQERNIQLWVRSTCSGSINGGCLLKKISLLDQFGYLNKLRRKEWMKRVRVLALKAGYVYMEFWSIRKSSSYLLVLNLNTMKLEIFRHD